MKKVNSREWGQEAPGPYWGPPDDYKDYTCVDEDINSPSGQISLIKRQDSEITSTSTDLEILDLRTNVKVKEVPKKERLEALDLRTNIKKGILNDGCSKTTLNGSDRALDLRISNVVSLKGINPTPSCVPDTLSDCGTLDHKSAKSSTGTKSVDTKQTTHTEAAKETRLIERVLMNKLPSMTQSDCGTLNHKLDKSSTITKPVDTELTSDTEAAMGNMAIKRVLRNKLLSMNFTKRLITPSCVSETLSDCGTLNHKSDKPSTDTKNADTKQTTRTAATKEPYRAIKRVLRNKLLSMNIANRLITLNVAKQGLIPSNTDAPGGTRDKVAEEVEVESNPGHCVPDVNMEHSAANGHIVLDIGDELNADLLDALLDSVLSEIKAKQDTSTKDSEDQIMPSASPNIFETDLMDDLDTPFHNDVEDSSFISHKQSILSPDQFPENWSIDCMEEFSRRNGFTESQCNQTVEKVSLSAYSYSETNITRISGECAIATSSPNSASKENSNGPADCHIPSHVFEYRGNKGDSLRTKDEDAKQNTNFHSLVQVPDLQALYTDKIEQMERDLSSIGTSHPQLEGQSPHHRIQQNSIQASMYQDENSNDACADEFLSWTCKHPENWDETEVLDWLFYSAERNGIDTTNLHGESFRLTGRDLCRMGIEEFQRREPQYGQYFYSWFRQLLNGLTFSQPSDMVVNTEPTILIPNDRYDQRFLDNSFSPNSHDADEMYYHQQPSSPTSPEKYYQYSQQAMNLTAEYGSVYPSQSMTDSQLYQGYDYPSTCSSEQVPSNQQDYVYDYSTQSCQPSPSSYRPTNTGKMSVTSVTSKYAGVLTPRRRPGRPRIKSEPTEEEKRVRLEKKMKSQHLWEFIFDLLNNPVYNPQVLKWENPKEGVFRFIQSETIAGLWGDLKNNENMTYEKLSRAMRHYYKRGILERVEGRRLVYKFSSSTLNRLREKRMSAFQTSSKVATVSNATAQFSGSAKQMNTPADDVRPNVPHSYKHQMLYKDSSPSDVLSTPGRTQYVGTNYAHAHELPVSCRETAHFPSEMTSHDVTNLSDIGFHNPTGKQFNAGVFDMTRNFHAPTDLTMQNLENKRGPTLPYLKHMV